jgi:hypothetical protein
MPAKSRNASKIAIFLMVSNFGLLNVKLCLIVCVIAC